MDGVSIVLGIFLLYLPGKMKKELSKSLSKNLWADQKYLDVKLVKKCNWRSRGMIQTHDMYLSSPGVRQVTLVASDCDHNIRRTVLAQLLHPVLQCLKGLLLIRINHNIHYYRVCDSIRHCFTLQLPEGHITCCILRYSLQKKPLWIMKYIIGKKTRQRKLI